MVRCFRNHLSCPQEPRKYKTLLVGPSVWVRGKRVTRGHRPRRKQSNRNDQCVRLKLFACNCTSLTSTGSRKSEHDAFTFCQDKLGVGLSSKVNWWFFSRHCFRQATLAYLGPGLLTRNKLSSLNTFCQSRSTFRVVLL